jgi:hypothetical protein
MDEQMVKYFTRNVPFNEDPAPGTQPIDYWMAKHFDAPELSVVARALLSIKAYEASCERSFSSQKLLHTALRNKLQPEVIQASQFIRLNEQKMRELEATKR